MYDDVFTLGCAVERLLLTLSISVCVITYASESFSPGAQKLKRAKDKCREEEKKETKERRNFHEREQGKFCSFWLSFQHR